MDIFQNYLLVRNIMLHANFETTKSLSLVNKQMNSIYYNPKFWEEKAEILLRILSKDFRNTFLSPDKQYLKLATLMDLDFSYESNRLIFRGVFIHRTVIKNRLDLLLRLMDEHSSDGYLQILIAAAMNSIDFSDRDLGSILDIGMLIGYLLAGNLKLFDENRYRIPDRWDESGFLEYSQDPEAFDHISSLIPDINKHLMCATEMIIVFGNKQLFDHIFRKYPLFPWNWNRLARGAIANGFKPLFDYILSLAPNYDYNWHDLAGQAIKFNHKDLFDHIRGLAPLDYKWNWEEFIKEAKKNKRWKFVDYLRGLM
jgi:hypothetical protein